MSYKALYTSMWKQPELNIIILLSKDDVCPSDIREDYEDDYYIGEVLSLLNSSKFSQPMNKFIRLFISLKSCLLWCNINACVFYLQRVNGSETMDSGKIMAQKSTRKGQRGRSKQINFVERFRMEHHMKNRNSNFSTLIIY